MERYEVIRDTREQQGWYWLTNAFCSGMVDETIKEGDYTLRGYEDIIRIERKASPAELARNVGKFKSRFDKEMKALADVKHKYIVCEFSLSDLLGFPKNATDIPDDLRGQIKITGKYIIRCLVEYSVKYGVEVLYCENKQNAFKITESIFKRIIEKYGS